MDPSQESAAHPFRPHIPLDTNMSTSQFDEGYSDGADSRSQPDSEMVFSDPTVTESEFQSLFTKAVRMSEEDRKKLMVLLIPTMTNKNKLDVKKYIEHLTHFDPAQYLPAELVLNIFSYLSPKDLLTAARVSRSWRGKTHDQKLWRACFAREGWVLDKDRMKEFEKATSARMKERREKAEESQQQNLGEEGEAVPSLQRRESRKRTRVEAFSDGETSASGMEGMEGMGGDDEEYEMDEKEFDLMMERREQVGMERRERMQGVETAVTSTPAQIRAREDADASGSIRAMHNNVPGTTISASRALEAYHNRISVDGKMFPDTDVQSPANFRLAPTLFHPSSNYNVSWEYLYKQRRRLEDNWDKGRYKMFSLPHADHPEEGHSECVYTIQHTASHLVSGSRDKTIRIWDLETQRLKREPLQGHEASVLCLQFDEREDQDIIVSGGSDAMVIIWKFSTGEVTKMLRSAHRESVLNLRFDDRYIVTCSKDKSIKVWNRHALERSEENAAIPKHVLADFMNPTLSLGGSGAMIEPFTLITSLTGHHAAVNAVMIHDTTIVSASGDRTIKAWDLHSGTVTKNYVGHTKGIACVQFDGRRIVSGSSDNTVRVFDADQQAEVACLQGHSNLVRTVQARFGDLEIVSDEELAAEAKRADLGFYSAVRGGMTPASVSRNARRNAGSSRPEEMLSVGAKVPPGGGGSRWAKIVSGSYDESVIVWRRERDGKWTVKQQLHQGQLLRGSRVRRQPALPAQVVQNQHGNPPQPGTLTAAQNGLAVAQHANALLQQGNAAIPGAALAIGAQMAALQQAQNPQGNPPGQAGQPIHAAQINGPQAPAQAPAQQPPHLPANAAPQPAQPNQQALPAGTNPTQPPPQGGGAGGGGHGGRNDSMRVFKLQFDARRIVCCSQNKVIVGWDFACGERALELVGGWSLETA